MVIAESGWTPAGAQRAGVAELTAEQRVQLATADDRRLPDEPALYPLLANVASWEPGAARAVAEGDDASPPDWASLVDSPGDYRGRLLVVEGRYAGRPRRQALRRAGPWGGSVLEWGLVTRAADGGEVVALVYLVDAAGRITPPRDGARVRVAGRFYKVWTDRDAGGEPRVYPVFVGREPVVVAAAAGGPGRGVIVVGLLAAVGALAALRWWAWRGRRRARPRRALRNRDNESSGDVRELPDDPAEALRALGADESQPREFG
jgi:hypothetical protein